MHRFLGVSMYVAVVPGIFTLYQSAGCLGGLSMKKRRSNKKGFTLIELVIIIAVIGILAAVLVPTFTNLIGQANYAADQSTVTNLNRTYATAKADKKITRNNTMYQAVKMVEGSNFKLDAIQHNSSNGNFIAWDSRHDEFVLVNEKNGTYEKNGQTIEIIDEWDFFRVYDSLPDKQDYSIYLSNKSIIGEVNNLTVGFDAGNNHSVTKLTYDRKGETSKREVRIRTNGGTDFTAHGYVSSTDPKVGDEIYHYGEAGKVIVDSAYSSFYENGSSVHTDVQKGHYVQNKGSVVGYLEASAKEGNVNITLKSGSLRGVLKNTNEVHAVSIEGEVDASTINAEIDNTKGEIKIKLETQPTYSNVVDSEGTNVSNNEYSISGLGTEERTAPTSENSCSSGHTFIANEESSIKVCSICGAYQYTKTSTAPNAHSAEEIQEKTYICENNGGEYIKINNTQGHEHHFSQEWAWVIDPEDSTKCIGASLTLQCTPESNDDPDDCDFSITLPAEITDNGATPHCTEEVTQIFTATVQYNGITYESTKEVTLQPVGHSWDDNEQCTRCHEYNIQTLFINADKYLYRVGNKVDVPANKIFSGTFNVEKIGFENDGLVGNASATKVGESIRFSGTGVVKITYGAFSLPVEVVDAKNIIGESLSSITDDDVVLLNDVNIGTISVTNHTIYGNGFKIKSKNDYGCSFQSDNGYVLLNNGSLDNVQIICPVFKTAVVFTNNASKDSNGKYLETRNAVAVNGESCTIKNSYISGGRSALYVKSSKVDVSNTTLHGGAYCNMIVDSTTTVTLRDVTLEQKEEDCTLVSGSKRMGLGIVVNNDGAQIKLGGEFKTYNWVSKEQITKYVGTYSTILKPYFEDSSFSHTYNGSNYICPSIIFACNWDLVNSVDNGTNLLSCEQSNKNDFFARDINMTLMGETFSGGIYAINSSFELNNSTIEGSDFLPNNYGVIEPSFSYKNDLNEGISNYGDDGVIKATINEGETITLDFSGITILKHDQPLDYTLSVTPTATIDGKKITFSDSSSDYIVSISASLAYALNKDGEKKELEDSDIYHYQWTVPVQLTINSEKPGPAWEEGMQTTGGHLWLVKNSGTSDPDYTEAVRIYDGITINYYNKDGLFVTRDLSNETPQPTIDTSKNAGVVTFDDGLTVEIQMQMPKPITEYTFQICNTQLYFYRSSNVRNNRDAITITFTYTCRDPKGKESEQFVKTFKFDTSNPGVYIKLDSFKQEKYETCSGEPGSCFAIGTLITMADGSQKAIENITQQDKILAWDFNKGCYVASDIFCVTNHGEDEYKIAHLEFSDGSDIEIISEHGMFDATTNRFENITTSNASDFVGHEFIKRGANDEIVKVLLKDVEIVNKITSAYSIISANYLNVIANEYWTLDPSIYFLVPFEINNEYMFDAKAMENDIETYGLMEYAEFEPYAPFMTEGQFNAGSGKYIKIALGKGIITMDEIMAFAQRILIDQQYIVE